MLLIKIDENYNSFNNKYVSIVGQAIIEMAKFKTLGPIKHKNQTIYIIPTVSMMQGIVIADIATKIFQQEKSVKRQLK